MKRLSGESELFACEVSMFCLAILRHDFSAIVALLDYLNYDKQMKYGNMKTEVDGVSFDSRKEAKHYIRLKQLADNKEIEDLRMQVKYELIPAIWEEQVVHLKTKDKTVRKCVQRAVHYIADFVYKDPATGCEVVVDVKGMRTKEYKLKKKMMRAFLGINIIEV